MAVIPVYQTLLVPEANLYMKNDDYTRLTGRHPQTDERVILVVLKEREEREQFSDDSFYPIGVSGSISEVNDNGYLVIRTRHRVNIEEAVVFPDKTVDVSISRRADIEDLDQEDTERRLKALKARLLKFSEGFQWGGMARGYIARFASIEEIAAAMSPWLMNGNEERYHILEEDSRAGRFARLEKLLFENLEMANINQEARSHQEEDHQKLYRESAIRKQMEYLQKELDAMHPEDVSDLRRLELKVEECGMNPTARKEADKVLSRLKQEGQNSPEAGMLHDYLDYLTSLPWKKEKPKKIKLEEAEQVLDADHFGLDKVKRRILQQIAVMSLKHQQSGSIILFVGAPGTGKTSIGQSIARALKRKYVRVSLGGVRDEADIRGHRRTYIGSMAGRIMDGIAKAGVSNPVMVLDEVDKLSASYNGDPASALLEVLDPEQNNTFTDHYLNVPYDLSDVLFICTANTVDTIPEPLLNRMEVIRFQGYTPLEKLEIAKGHLLPKSMEAVGIKEGELTVSEEALRAVIADYTREAGVRGLKKRMDQICRTAAVELVGGTKPPIAVEPERLREYLDMAPLHHRQVPESAAPGIVTGLAWTSAGGEILYIETMLTPGSGKITVTGQLGDVMKESAQIAVSLVKSLFPEKAETFSKSDLHIHVPDGATPKDGPSAGITLTTALASLVTGKHVPPSIGMTGEVSLRGEVGPIGGLPEKLMAADRAGVKQVFIPADNEDDLREVAAEVKERLAIVPVSTVAEVLKKLEIA